MCLAVQQRVSSHQTPSPPRVNALISGGWRADNGGDVKPRPPRLSAGRPGPFPAIARDGVSQWRAALKTAAL
ncbi:hypothetical protein ACOMHN_019064 [Nucella lapillus]